MGSRGLTHGEGVKKRNTLAECSLRICPAVLESPPANFRREVPTHSKEMPDGPGKSRRDWPCHDSGTPTPLHISARAEEEARDRLRGWERDGGF